MAEQAYHVTLKYEDGAVFEYTFEVDGWLSTMADSWAQRLAPRDDIPQSVITTRVPPQEGFTSDGTYHPA